MTDNKQGKKLFLLDAYALIYRSYFAFISNPRYNSKGQNTSAIYGFVNTLNEVLHKERPTHIAVAFDPMGPTFRHEMFAPYKANREEAPEDIKNSIPYIKRIIKGFNIPIVEVAGYEADDVVGTLAKRAEKDEFKVFMMTPDKDYAQLVSEHIFMYKPRKKGNSTEEILGVEEIKEFFGVNHPKQVIDILALWGDSADNVPGCPGIGEKTSKKLIQQYGSIDNIFQHIDDFKGKQKENLINFKEQIKMSYTLVTIKIDVPIEVNFEDLKVTEFNNTILEEVFEELEFKTFSQKIINKEIKPSVRPSKTETLQGNLFDFEDDQKDENEKMISRKLQTIDTVDHHYFLIDNAMKRASLKAELSILKEFCFDTETTGLDANNSELVGLSFAFKKGEAYYVPISENQDEAKKIVREFKTLFEDEKILKIGQNIKYDMLVLKWYGINLKGKLFDTMLAHYLLEPSLKHNMDFLSEIYLKYKPVSIETLIGKKGKNQGNMRDVSIEKIKEYASEDADITFQLKEILLLELKKEKMMPLFEEIEMPLIEVLTDMEFAGVKIDVVELNKYAINLKEQIKKAVEQIHHLAGVSFNISSPKQLGEILFDRMKIISNAKKTKTAQYSTSEETLMKIKDKHPIISKILTSRSLIKLLSTYVEALPKMINKKTNNIHTSFNQAVTATGRLSSNNPNLQNIPIRTENGKEVRKAFICLDKNHIFLSADYSQIELRIMAVLSKDKNMMQAFKNDEDIHTLTASNIFNISPHLVSPDMRRKAKVANFGIIYGISSFGLAQRLNIPRKEGKELINNYFKTYPDIKAFMDKSIAFARETLYVETIKGRKRHLKDINSRNGIVRGNAERNAINAPIQGSSADIIKIAMINIFRKFREEKLQSKMILQVHDELNFDVVETELEQVKKIVKYEMENAISLSIPMTVDMGTGTNWLEAH